LPEEVPGVTVDRQCGSSQQALHFAAQAVMSGTSDLVVCGGVQNMSMIPIGTAWRAGAPFGHDDPFSGSVGWVKRYGDAPVNQFRGAQTIAEEWDVSREDMERFAFTSHQRAVAAIDAGRFAAEIAPIAGVEHDEGPRRDTSLEKMATLQPLWEGGRITAAVSSQISDGAAAILIASDAAVRAHNLVPRARVAAMGARGADPIRMLTAPIPATRWVLGRAGLTLDEMACVEINEAFASVVCAWTKDLGADPERVNPNGGAIALGHPLGATGARLVTSLLGELERRRGRYGLVTMCEGGGQANVTVIERV
jgi:acetyl-CoA C-acetyltransferase